MDARLIEIETKLAFQEDALQTLSDVMARQERSIEQLQAKLDLVLQRLAELSENQVGPNSLAAEKPPHY